MSTATDDLFELHVEDEVPARPRPPRQYRVVVVGAPGLHQDELQAWLGAGDGEWCSAPAVAVVEGPWELATALAAGPVDVVVAPLRVGPLSARLLCSALQRSVHSPNARLLLLVDDDEEWRDAGPAACDGVIETRGGRPVLDEVLARIEEQLADLQQCELRALESEPLDLVDLLGPVCAAPVDTVFDDEDLTPFHDRPTALLPAVRIEAPVAQPVEVPTWIPWTAPGSPSSQRWLSVAPLAVALVMLLLVLGATVSPADTVAQGAEARAASTRSSRGR